MEGRLSKTTFFKKNAKFVLGLFVLLFFKKIPDFQLKLQRGIGEVVYPSLRFFYFLIFLFKNIVFLGVSCAPSDSEFCAESI